MEDTLHLIDVIILIGISQGVFLSFGILRIPENNKKANSILSILIGVCTLILIGRYIFYSHLTISFYQLSLVFDSLIFLFAPLLYIYTRRLLYKENLDYLLPIYHLTPFFLFLIGSILNLFIYTSSEYYQSIIIGDYILLFNTTIVIMIAYNTYYLIRSSLLVSSYKENEKHVFSFEQSPLTYLYLFHFVMFICFGIWLFSFITQTVFGTYSSIVNYDTLWMVIPGFLYIIGYFSLKQPALFRMPIEEKKNVQKIRISPKESIILKKKLDVLMKKEKLFLQGDLTLTDVAGRLETSRNNISWLLNNYYNLTFNDFINSYRIKEFIRKIEEGQHLSHTILAISIDVGFNSKSTFNKAFKHKMGDTPSSFIRKKEAIV